MSINDTGITVTMKDGQAIDLGDFLQSAMNEIADEFDQLKRRLSALEANLKWLYEESGLDYPTPPEQAQDGVPSTPPDTQGEWIPWNWASLIWVLFEDGTIGICHTSDLGGHDKTVVAIMPYHPGDSKPLPPEVK